jgi:hypothetical protein
MRLTRPSLLTLSAVLLSAGYSIAQVGDTPTSQPAAARTLSLQDQLQTAKTYLQDMKEASDNVRASLEQARANRDVVKVLCLNDKLSQIGIASRSANGRVDTLGTAVGQNDTAKARHDFAVLEVLQERVTALVAEANQCVGEEVGFVGESNTKVTVDPKIPDPDVDQLGSDVGPVLSSPVLSSPVL